MVTTSWRALDTLLANMRTRAHSSKSHRYTSSTVRYFLLHTCYLRISPSLHICYICSCGFQQKLWDRICYAAAAADTHAATLYVRPKITWKLESKAQRCYRRTKGGMQRIKSNHEAKHVIGGFLICCSTSKRGKNISSNWSRLQIGSTFELISFLDL